MITAVPSDLEIYEIRNVHFALPYMIAQGAAQRPIGLLSSSKVPYYSTEDGLFSFVTLYNFQLSRFGNVCLFV